MEWNMQRGSSWVEVKQRGDGCCASENSTYVSIPSWAASSRFGNSQFWILTSCETIIIFRFKYSIYTLIADTLLLGERDLQRHCDWKSFQTLPIDRRFLKEIRHACIKRTPPLLCSLIDSEMHPRVVVKTSVTVKTSVNRSQFWRGCFWLERVQNPTPVPFRSPWSRDAVKGWIDLTYLSPRLGIARGNKGTTFVLAKEEE